MNSSIFEAVNLTPAECEYLIRQEKDRRLQAYPERNFPHDPIGYSEQILGKGRLPTAPPFWWSKQQEIARALLVPPHRVLVRACHSVGKSHAVAGIINWYFDNFDPGIVLTTSPKYDQVKDVLWKEIRLQRKGRNEVFPGPKAPRMETREDHYATGFTATKGGAAQGQHESYNLCVIDEAVAVDKEIWLAMDSMASHFLAICNPTDPGSEFYAREQSGRWHVIHISALDHPNIAAELQGLPAPYPKAIRLGWLRDRIKDWCELLPSQEAPTDIFFEGQWWRPGPLAECRLLGRWPSAAGNVWSESLFLSCETRTEIKLDLARPPEIGVDVARFGDDDTAIHVRWGGMSLHHESHNGWGGPQIVGRLKELCKEFADKANTVRRNHQPHVRPFKPTEIPVKVDASGMGGMGVVDWHGDYLFVEVNAGSSARNDVNYKNIRSELWFELAERARIGLLSFNKLSPEIRLKLRLEALAPSYTLDAADRRVVEEKKITKERLHHSPDNMDAVNLAYYEAGDGVAHWADPAPDRSPDRAGGVYGIMGRETSKPAPEMEPTRGPRANYGFLGT